MGKARIPRAFDITIVVAGNEGQFLGFSEPLYPSSGGRKFIVSGDIHHVAGQRHMIGRLGKDIGGDQICDGGIVQLAAVELPGKVTHQPLQLEIPPCRPPGQRSQMNVREMGEGEQG